MTIAPTRRTKNPKAKTPNAMSKDRKGVLAGQKSGAMMGAKSAYSKKSYHSKALAMMPAARMEGDEWFCGVVITVIVVVLVVPKQSPVINRPGCRFCPNAPARADGFVHSPMCRLIWDQSAHKEKSSVRLARRPDGQDRYLQQPHI